MKEIKKYRHLKLISYLPKTFKRAWWTWDPREFVALHPYLPPSSAVLIVILNVDTILLSLSSGDVSALVVTLYLFKKTNYKLHILSSIPKKTEYYNYLF